MSHMEKPDWAIAAKVLADGRIVTVVPLTFGRARLCVGRNWATYDDGF